MKTTGVIAALKRARVPIFTIAATYAGFLLLGMAFVHAGNGFALRERDDIVTRAYARDPAAIAFKQNRRLRAAALDFTRNLFLGGNSRHNRRNRHPSCRTHSQPTGVGSEESCR